MTIVEAAERKSRARAVLFYLQAAALLVSAALMLDRSGTAVTAPIIAWAMLGILVSFNLLPWATRWRAGLLGPLLEDEGTQANRRKAFEAGFWAAIATSILLMTLAPFVSIAGSDIARLILSVALAAALTAFATLELRAARG